MSSKNSHMYTHTITPSEQLFLDSGPFFHLCTTPLESDVLFLDTERAPALNYLAISAAGSPCRLLAYSIMSNHFHFVLEGQQNHCVSFWNTYRTLLEKYLNRHGRSRIMNRVEVKTIRIDDLRQLRNPIAYVIRNAFAARTDVHVFTDPWSSGYLYFNPLLRKDGVSAASLKGLALRKFTRSRMINGLDERIMVRDGQAQPWSFVDYPFTERFYDSARQFIHSVLKNVEAMVELDLSLGERPVLSDDEMIPLSKGSRL